MLKHSLFYVIGIESSLCLHKKRKNTAEPGICVGLCNFFSPSTMVLSSKFHPPKPLYDPRYMLFPLRETSWLSMNQLLQTYRRSPLLNKNDEATDSDRLHLFVRNNNSNCRSSQTQDHEIVLQCTWIITAQLEFLLHDGMLPSQNNF